MTSDPELLARFARHRSEDAFAELVRRHVNLVYSAALRQVGGDGHLAQDVAQTVFSDLARKAPALARRATLTGWLHTSAPFAAARIVRAEHRRREREEQFMREPNDAAPETDWEQLRPVLDEVMRQLQETDREAILLRYFENRPFAEIGAYCVQPPAILGPPTSLAISDWMILNSRRTALWTRNATRAFSASGFHFKGPGDHR